MNKTKSMILFWASLLFFGSSVCAQENESPGNQKMVTAPEVEVFYFHFTRRCATCQAVEDVSKQSVEDLYGDKVFFASYNLEEPEGEKKGEEVGVTGQALVIVSGDKKIDITSDGFMNARSNPGKLKEIIKEKIDPLL